jgi:flagellar basal-body rod protein FlgF
VVDDLLRGFYSAASGMLAQQRRTEILTNNIANANTPGYKTDQSSLRSFPELLLQRMESNALPSQKVATSTPIGSLNTGVYVQEANPLFRQGDLQETGLKMDIALVDGNIPLNGSLFFTVENQEGNVSYTRKGKFNLDPAGFLTTNEGNYVLDINRNRIQLQSEQFQVDANGRIIENGAEVAQLNIAFSEDTSNLVKNGYGLYNTSDDTELASANENQAVSYSLQQGFIERSNVDVAAAMTDMMTAYRAFEANQKILQAYDKSMEKAANEIGRIG